MLDLAPLLDVRDLASLLGLSEHGVRAMIRRGEIPAARLGRRLIVRREALFEVLQAREREQRPGGRPDRAEEIARVLRRLPPPRRQRMIP